VQQGCKVQQRLSLPRRAGLHHSRVTWQLCPSQPEHDRLGEEYAEKLLCACHLLCHNVTFPEKCAADATRNSPRASGVPPITGRNEREPSGRTDRSELNRISVSPVRTCGELTGESKAAGTET